MYFAESSGLKLWKYTTSDKVPHSGNLDTDNQYYSELYYGRGNSEKDGRVNIVVRKETNSTKTAGNVLIALRKKEVDGWSPIIWSWHLWVTDYNPDAAGEWTDGVFQKSTPGDDGNTTGNGQRDARVLHYGYWGKKYQWIMDRHLGALGWRPNGVENGKTYKAFGLYYQWGRKDPFPAQRLLKYGQDVSEIQLYNIRGQTTDTKIESIKESNGTILTKATNHPRRLYKEKVITTYASDEHHWNHPSVCAKQGTKSIFDPCPPGWEVAATDVYNGLVKHTEGSTTELDNSDGKYAVKFIYATEQSNSRPPKYVWSTQEQVNDGAWLISASGQKNADGEPSNPTYYPNSGFIQQSGMKEMTGLGDLWCADQKNKNSGSFFYLGYSVEDLDVNGLLLRCEFPTMVLKNSGAPDQFTKEYAFSVRCVKK